MASSDGDRDVFSGLPKARPQRRSAKRAQPDAAPKGKARPAAKKAPPQARAAASTRPAPASRAKAKAEPKPKPTPVPPAGYATPTDDDRPRGTDLVGTAVQAAGELAQIGITVGARALKSAVQRLPRP